MLISNFWAHTLPWKVFFLGVLQWVGLLYKEMMVLVLNNSHNIARKNMEANGEPIYHAWKWWKLLNHAKVEELSNEWFEKLFLARWYQDRKKDNEIHKDFFSGNAFILQVHGCIHKEKVVVSINPRCKHNFISVNLAKILQVPIKKIHSTQVGGENVQFFKDLKVTIDKYVFHSNFISLYMDVVDVVLGYPWMDSVGTVNLHVQNKFLKLWYKKRKSPCRIFLFLNRQIPKGYMMQCL